MNEIEDPAGAILAERARALARPALTALTGAELTVVEFSIRDETFRIGASFVREVVRLLHLANVPDAPPAVRAVTTYRGEILALLDLRAVFGRPDGGLADLLWVVVIGNAAAEFGVLADSVTSVTRIHVDDLRPLSEDASPVARRLALAVTADAALMLDGAAMLADAELFTVSALRVQARKGSVL